MNQSWNYETEKETFHAIGVQEKICTYIDLPSFSAMNPHTVSRRGHYIARIVAHCARIHVGCMLPRLKDHSGMSETDLANLKELYGALLKNAASSSVSVGFASEHAYQEYLLRTLPQKTADRLSGKMLVMYEYLCDRKPTITYKLHDSGTLMSVVAFDDDKLKPETIDLREFIVGDRIVWSPSFYGNWRILEFVCERDPSALTADVLSYGVSKEMLHAVWDLFSDTIDSYAGKALDMLEYHDISFDAPNRRTWTESFNDAFRSLYGFDPAPYYPALFRSVGAETRHLRSLFFACRAKMIQNGYLRAIADLAAEKGLTLHGSVTEPKLSACPWITGDNLLNGTYAPGALLDKAYLYGTNSLKIAAAAAYNFDHERVSCELYRSYYRASKSIFYNDAMNALARGANMMMVHIPLLEAQEHRNMIRSLLASHWESDFSKYIGRIQTLLTGGSHIADIALLYPIYSLCGSANFYISPANRFEYPNSPTWADYMNVINGISTYAGHDLTILHPETLNERCHTENGVLYLNNEKNKEEFRILILPAASIVSLENLRKVAAFYDGGGKIIATGVLPSAAYEFTPDESPRGRRSEENENDREVRRLVEHIFGKESCDPYIVRPFFYHENENGGEAYFLPFTATAADETRLTKSKLLSEAIHSFDLPLDIYMPDMPRFECIGALNSVYHEFEALGLAQNIPGGGMLNHIHKRRGDCDIYYFSNTTSDPFDSYLLLRGRLSPEEWNPYTGKTRPLPHTAVSFRNTHYTRIPVSLPPSGSILFLSDPSHADREEPSDERAVTEIEGLV